MAYTVTKIEVWSGAIPNKPGGLAAALAALAEAGANLSFVLARRQSHKPEEGVVYLTPIQGAAQQKAAKAAGLARAADLSALRVEGADKPGVGAAITKTLAGAGINLRGLSAVGVGRKFVAHIAFDSAADARKAAKLLGGA